jgi:CRP-like cAMP-binding protein
MDWIREAFTFQDQQRLLFKLAERVKAFRGLSPGEIAELLGQAEKCTYEADVPVVREGNTGTHMYILMEGTAVVVKQGHGGEVELARMAPADSFGEMALADREARSATVRTLSPCVLVRLDIQAVEARPEIGMKIYRNIARLLAERLRHADERLAWRL